MRTLIDVSLFVHTRRAWHGKQYFTLATIVVAWSVSLPFSLSLHLTPLPFSPRPIRAHLIASSLSPSSPSRSRSTEGPKGAPGTSARYLIAGSQAMPRIIRATCALPPACCLRLSTCVPRGRGGDGGPNWGVGAASRLINVLQSRISGSRTRAIYTGPRHGPLPWGKIIWMFR